MDQPTEPNWLPVVGWDSFYLVSDLGDIWSTRSGRLLRQPLDTRGYPRVSLCLNGGEITRKVATLVAQAFLGPRPDGLEVRHLDGNKLNSAASNLTYGTHSENQRDLVRHGTHHAARRTHCKSGHKFTPANTWMSRDGRRHCRACNRERARKRKLAERAAREAA